MLLLRIISCLPKQLLYLDCILVRIVNLLITVLGLDVCSYWKLKKINVLVVLFAYVWSVFYGAVFCLAGILMDSYFWICSILCPCVKNCIDEGDAEEGITFIVDSIGNCNEYKVLPFSTMKILKYEHDSYVPGVKQEIKEETPVNRSCCIFKKMPESVRISIREFNSAAEV